MRREALVLIRGHPCHINASSSIYEEADEGQYLSTFNTIDHIIIIVVTIDVSSVYFRGIPRC